MASVRVNILTILNVWEVCLYVFICFIICTIYITMRYNSYSYNYLRAIIIRSKQKKKILERGKIYSKESEEPLNTVHYLGN